MSTVKILDELKNKKYMKSTGLNKEEFLASIQPLLIQKKAMEKDDKIGDIKEVKINGKNIIIVTLIYGYDSNPHGIALFEQINETSKLRLLNTYKDIGFPFVTYEFMDMAPTEGDELLLHYNSTGMGSGEHVNLLEIVADPFKPGISRAVF